MAGRLGVCPTVAASIIIAQVRCAAQGQMSQWACGNLVRIFQGDFFPSSDIVSGTLRQVPQPLQRLSSLWLAKASPARFTFELSK
jgi:hypothetical protein